jgi:hypothetical protein
MLILIAERNIILNTETDAIWKREVREEYPLTTTPNGIVIRDVDRETEMVEHLSCNNVDVPHLQGLDAQVAWSAMEIVARMQARILDGEYAAVMERERMLRPQRYGNQSGRRGG